MILLERRNKNSNFGDFPVIPEDRIKNSSGSRRGNYIVADPLNLHLRPGEAGIVAAYFQTKSFHRHTPFYIELSKQITRVISLSINIQANFLRIEVRVCLNMDILMNYFDSSFCYEALGQNRFCVYCIALQ